VRIRFRRFLLMLLMVGLPLQTFAAACMLTCAGQHLSTEVQAVAEDEAMAGCHRSEHAPPRSHDCKHCALCVLASALPIPASETAGWVKLAPFLQTHVAVLFSGFIPDGPERPPRASLA
jgi:hypothetical protein